MGADGVKTERRKKKSWYKSKTILLNALIGGLGAAQAVMTGGATGWDLISVAVANGALRGATTGAIGK